MRREAERLSAGRNLEEPTEEGRADDLRQRSGEGRKNVERPDLVEGPKCIGGRTEL